MHWLVRSSSFSKAQELRETGPWLIGTLTMYHNNVNQEGMFCGEAWVGGEGGVL